MIRVGDTLIAPRGGKLYSLYSEFGASVSLSCRLLLSHSAKPLAFSSHGRLASSRSCTRYVRAPDRNSRSVRPPLRGCHFRLTQLSPRVLQLSSHMLYFSSERCSTRSSATSPSRPSPALRSPNFLLLLIWTRTTTILRLRSKCRER